MIFLGMKVLLEKKKGETVANRAAIKSHRLL